MIFKSIGFYYISLSFFFGVNALLFPIFWSFFYFGPYILILPLLVPKPINAVIFVISVGQPMEIVELADGGIKIL